MHPQIRKVSGADGREYSTWLTIREFPSTHSAVGEHLLYFAGTTGNPLRMLYLDFATTIDELSEQDLEELLEQAQRME